MNLKPLSSFEGGSSPRPLRYATRTFLALLLVGLALISLAACGEQSGAPASVGSPDPSVESPAPPDPALADAIFPLRVAANGRHLVDSSGRPFLLHGDTAWSLIVQLPREGVERYLGDRRARGFNALLVNLIEHRFADNAPRNWYGDEPFVVPGDFSTPNEAYFEHAEWVLEQARAHGFAVLLVPAYLGYGGGDEGWYQTLLANSQETLRGYGRFLGERYRRLDNIIWTHGGDYNPPERHTVSVIAEEIQAILPDRLATAHGARETAAADYWEGEPWLTLNNVYTGGPVFLPSLQQYARPGPMPFFLLEGIYENERQVTTTRLRTQAYHALLSGAAGQFFGNNPIWHFDGPGLFPTGFTWQQALDSPGSRSMGWLWGLFSGLEWWTLEPDTGQDLLVGGLGEGHERAVAALSSDGRLAVGYLPSARTVEVDLSVLRGPRVTVEWFDPTNGARSSVTGSPFPADAVHGLSPPGPNAARDPDWVILMRSTE
jgi:hypothetical protein